MLLVQINNSTEMAITLLMGLVLIMVVSAALDQYKDDVEYCRAIRCREDGPIIRFPFWLKGRQPDGCGYPGFGVSCSKSKDTVLEIPFYANTSQEGLVVLFYVEAFFVEIDYTSQQALVYTRLISNRGLTTLNSSSVASTPFQFSGDPDPKVFRYPWRKQGYDYYYDVYNETSNYTLVSCPSFPSDIQTLALMTSHSGGDDTRQVYIEDSDVDTLDLPIISCTKIHTIVSIPSELPFLHDPSDYFIYIINWKTPNCPSDYCIYIINWKTPNCRGCEAKGDYCKLADQNASIVNNNTTCFPIPQQALGPDHAPHTADAAIRAGVIPSVVLVTLVLAVLMHHLIRSHRRKKDDQLKIEMFLENYEAMKPTRYTYSDIKKITRHFSHKLGQGGFGSVYKGQISDKILVAVKVLKSDTKSDGEDFINEVGTIGQIHHVNVVRLVGYCADACNRALVYEFQPNQSLEKYVHSGKSHGNSFLGWEKMQEIALGIAKGIEYLHQGCAQRILHFDIKPHNILLDQNFHPKISDFGLAKLCSKDQSIVSMTMARGTIGYIAPEVFSRNFGKVSPKSDVYSFGMLLLEMVGGRNADNNAENASETYFPEWIYHRLERGEVTIQVDDEDDSNIARKLTIVGLWCIGWHPVDRPSMRHVIQMLEREGYPAMPANPFKSTNSANATAARPFMGELEAISESE